jgi:type IV pilus assembly protein PilV
VILSIGLLGIVGLITMSKTSQHQAIQRTRAVTVADAIVERIRINPAGIATYNIGLNAPVGLDPNQPEPSPDCLTATCTPAELAAHDLWAWGQAMSGAITTVNGVNTGGLISPRGCIVFTPAASKTRSGILNVLVQWRGLTETYDAVQGSESVCGAGAAGGDKYRRQVAVNTFVIDETEF